MYDAFIINAKYKRSIIKKSHNKYGARRNYPADAGATNISGTPTDFNGQILCRKDMSYITELYVYLSTKTAVICFCGILHGWVSIFFFIPLLSFYFGKQLVIFFLCLLGYNDGLTVLFVTNKNEMLNMGQSWNSWSIWCQSRVLLLCANQQKLLQVASF